MKRIQKSISTPHSAEKIYRIIAQAENYPEFLPWCADAQIHHRQALPNHEEEVIASLSIKAGPFNKSFTTKNHLIPFHKIEMNLVEGPFKTLHGIWQITPEDSGCRIDFDLTFEFKSKMLALALEKSFDQIMTSLMDAFIHRADVLS